MSEYDLIPEETYDNLPADENDKFAILVRVAQNNLARMLDSSNSNDFAAEIRAQFISIITGIADALGVEGLPAMNGHLIDYDKYQMFQVYLAGVVAKVRLQGQLVARPLSVALGRVTKARIQQEIDQLRRSVNESDLPDKKKSALRDKLSELEEELAKQRLSFARTMAIAASIMTCLGGGATFVAELPDAGQSILKIIQWVGEDKEKEETERLRLTPPPKALPDFSAKQQVASGAFGFDDLDDDVPF